MCANKLTNLNEFLIIFKKLKKASQIAMRACSDKKSSDNQKIQTNKNRNKEGTFELAPIYLPHSAYINFTDFMKNSNSHSFMGVGG